MDQRQQRSVVNLSGWARNMACYAGLLPNRRLGQNSTAIQMKRTILGVFICALLVTWFLVSPFLGIARLRAAVEARNPAAIEDRVDFRRLRLSLGTQIVSAYLRLTGRAQQFGSLGNALAATAGASLADPLLSDVLTSEAILNFLSGAKSSPIPTSHAGDMLNVTTPDTIWKAFVNSE